MKPSARAVVTPAAAKEINQNKGILKIERKNE